MTRQFITNLAFLLFLNLLVKPVSIFLDIQVQNEVGAETYGWYFAIFNFTYLFHLVLDFGISNYNNRSVASDDEHLTRYLPSLLMLKLILAGIFTCLVFVGAWWVGFSPKQLGILKWLILNQVLLSAILFFRSNISGMHLFKTDSMISVLDKLLLIGLLTAAILSIRNCTQVFKIEWFVWAQTISLGTTALVAGIIVAIRSRAVRLYWDFAAVKKMLKATYPYALLGILMTVYYRIDGVMVERMLPDGAEQAGIYAAAYRLLDAANILGLLFASLLLPMFAKMISKNQSVNELVNFSFKTLFAGSLLLSFLIFLFQDNVIQALYFQADTHWAEVLGMLFVSYAALGTVYVFGALLTANGSMRALNIIALSGAGANVILNYFLIPIYGALGAAIATVVTQWAVALAHILVARQTFKLVFGYGLLVRLGIYLIALIILAIGSFGLWYTLNWQINFVLYSICGLALAFVLRLIDIRQIFQLAKARYD